MGITRQDLSTAVSAGDTWRGAVDIDTITATQDGYVVETDDGKTHLVRGTVIPRTTGGR